MKRTLLVLCLLATPAFAQDAPPIPGTPPAGWVPNKDHAKAVHQGILIGLPDGLTTANVRVYSYSAPQGGGQVMFSVVDVPVPDDEAAAAYVRARVDDLHGTTALMAADGGKVRTVSWREDTDEANRVVDALLEWAHDGNQTHSLVRAAWIKLAPGVVEEVRAECVLAADQVEALRPACAEALASMLVPEAAARLPISAAEPAPPAADDPPPQMTATPPGTPVPMKPVVQPSPERDWRGFYVLGGLIVLAAALMWNRKRREAYDAEADAKRDDADAARSGTSEDE